MTLLIGFDAGTTSIKAVLYDAAAGKVIRIATRPTPVQHPQPGWSEHDPEALWQATVACLHEAASGQTVAGLAISSMAEAGVLIDKEGKPLSPIIAWYDRRSEPQAAWIEEQISLPDLYRITGQRASPSFGATKILWVRDTFPDLFARASKWLPVPAYLLWRMTGSMAVDYTIAARTLLFDQGRLDWSQELLDRFHLPHSLLPPVLPGGTAVGTLTAQAASETGIPVKAVCGLGGHDHLCAALAAGAQQEGAVVDSTGSANALLLLLNNFLPDPALGQRGFASYAFVLQDRYVLKAGLKAAGSAVEWLARQLSMKDSEPDYSALESDAASGIGWRAGPIWLPHLIGSGTPQGDRFSRAAIVGVQFEHTRGDLFRGMLESLAFWTRQNLDEMQALSHARIQSLALLGGVTRLKLLSQLKADVLNMPVYIPAVPEAAATGAALLAGLSCGAFRHSAEAIDSLRYDGEIIEPSMERAAWYEALYREAYIPLYEAVKPVHEALRRIDKISHG